MNQTELSKAYEELHGRFEDAGRSLNDFSLADLQTLITYEVWADGCELEMAADCAKPYATVDSARHYLEQVFGYGDKV